MKMAMRAATSAWTNAQAPRTPAACATTQITQTAKPVSHTVGQSDCQSVRRTCTRPR